MYSSVPKPSSAERARGATPVVKKSTMMLPRRYCVYGRNEATTTAQPSCTSSTSPWIGLENSARPSTLTTVTVAIAISVRQPIPALASQAKRSARIGAPAEAVSSMRGG